MYCRNINCDYYGDIRTKCNAENETIASIRSGISGIFKDDFAKRISAASIAIILQEMGDADASIILIERYGLETVYGIKREVK